jgi:hypothetical protein
MLVSPDRPIKRGYLSLRDMSNGSAIPSYPCILMEPCTLKLP